MQTPDQVEGESLDSLSTCNCDISDHSEDEHELIPFDYESGLWGK